MSIVSFLKIIAIQLCAFIDITSFHSLLSLLSVLLCQRAKELFTLLNKGI